MLISSFFTSFRFNRAAAQLAAARENLREAELAYNLNYPTDKNVEVILAWRKKVAHLEEKAKRLGRSNGGEF